MIITILICIGMAIGLIVITFVYEASEYYREWVYRKVKISSIKFEFICRISALMILGVFYLLYVVGLIDSIPYSCVIFIYADIILFCIAPLKWQAEFKERQVKQVYWKEDDLGGRSELCNVFLGPVIDIWIVIELYSAIIKTDLWTESPLIENETFRMAVIGEIFLISSKIVLNRRIKKKEKEFKK